MCKKFFFYHIFFANRECDFFKKKASNFFKEMSEFQLYLADSRRFFKDVVSSLDILHRHERRRLSHNLCFILDDARIRHYLEQAFFQTFYPALYRDVRHQYWDTMYDSVEAVSDQEILFTLNSILEVYNHAF